VVAQTSVFQYKGKALDVREIGTALRADTVLEGSVRKAGPILRITAQLADVMTGYILWSGNFERLLEDVFAVQEEIARAIAEALKGQFPEESAGSLPREVSGKN
jgi:TolB-like protein